VAQNRNGAGSDPMAQLDAAMNETFQELAEQGSGVSPSDVAPHQTARADGVRLRATTRPTEAGWNASSASSHGRHCDGAAQQPKTTRPR